MNKRFLPKIDKMFWWILIPTAILLLAVTVVTVLSAPLMLLVMVPVDFFCLYFIISPLFGYVELCDELLFIKFGFFMKREIPYSKIRGTSRERKFYADSMMSLKNSLDHVNIKYNTFDLVSISVVENDKFIAELNEKFKNNVTRDQ